MTFTESGITKLDSLKEKYTTTNVKLTVQSD